MNQLPNQSVTMLRVEQPLAPPGLAKTLKKIKNSQVSMNMQK